MRRLRHHFSWKRQLVCGVIALSFCVCATGAPPEQERELARQNELERRAAQEQTERLRRLKDHFMLQVKQTGQLLTQLAGAQDAFAKQREALLTSDEGKALAADPVSFMAIRELLKHPSVTSEEIIAKQSAINSIITNLNAEIQQVDVGYLPSAETQQEVSELYVWVRERTARLAGEKATLKTLLTEAARLEDAAKSQTLARAMEEYDARWYQTLAKSKILGEKAAAAESQQVLVDAARLARMEHAKAESDKLLEQSRSDIAQMKLDQELLILQVKRDAERKSFEAQRAYLDAQAEVERLRKDAEVKRATAASDAAIVRNETLDDAKHREQVALVNGPEVRELLAPFFAKGYWLPHTRHTSYQAEPMSLSVLSKLGALQPTDDGLLKLLKVATDSHDRDRPRWRFGKSVRLMPRDERARLAQAQQWLIQLGHVMVEQGLLAP